MSQPSQPKAKGSPPPVEEGDFYFDERGLMVFTERYHLKRGSCCESGCKHCPYGFRREP